MTDDQMRGASDHDLLIMVATEQRTLIQETGTLKHNVAALNDSYQNHTLRLSEMERRCNERHRHDTDECERVAGLAARMEVAERDLADLKPRFDETESSVVEHRAEQATLARIRAEAARRWQIIAAIATVTGTLAGMGLFKLLGG